MQPAFIERCSSRTYGERSSNDVLEVLISKGGHLRTLARLAESDRDPCPLVTEREIAVDLCAP